MSSPSPLVTVITPTYNRADLLPETIASVLAQDYPNFEYIVLDDGSLDNTQEVLKQYDDPRMRWESHPNMGEAQTVNKGFRLAKGDYVIIVNSDDPLLPNHLKLSVEFMEKHPDVLAGYPDWVMIDDNSERIKEYTCSDYNYIDMLRWYFCMPGPGTLIRRTAFDFEPNRDPKFSNAGDFEYWLRLGLHGPFARIPHFLATWRNHAGTTTSTLQGANVSNERIEMLDKLFDHPKMSEEVRKIKRQAYGSAHYVTGILSVDEKRTQAAYHFMKSITICPIGCRPNNHPRQWGFMVYIMLSALLPKIIRRPLGKIKVALQRNSK